MLLFLLRRHTIKADMMALMVRSRRLLAALVFASGILLPGQVSAISDVGVVISELQVTDDVIELSNVSEDTVDISGWVIQTKATGSTSDWINRFVFPDSTLLYPDGSLLVTATDLLTNLTDFHIAFNMSAEKGHVRIIENTESGVFEHDKVGWGTEALDAETEPAPKPTLGLTLQRLVQDNSFIDTDNNLADFQLAAPTFSNLNTAPIPANPPPVETPEPDPIDQPTDPPIEDSEVPVSDPVVEPNPESSPPPIDPVVVPVVYSPVFINEIFPDPSSPLLDANDEWIELFNPTEQEIQLENYVIKTGANATYSYTLGPVVIPPQGYVVLYSADTNLTLSNSGGAVRIYTPDQTLVSEQVYSDAKEGWSYMKQSDGLWYWTTTPTVGLVNVYTVPTVAQKTVKAAVAKATKSPTVKATTTKKTTAVKAATKKSTKASTEERSVFEEPAVVDAQPPLHPAILAAGAALAVLYGLYEYRSDFRNLGFRLGSYRSARQKNRH